jgi:hypothetical protein
MSRRVYRRGDPGIVAGHLTVNSETLMTTRPYERPGCQRFAKVGL